MPPVNLKPYYDAAFAADAEVKRIMAEMDAAFNEGTEEGKTKALELRPKLDEAKKKAGEANQLYISMRDAASESERSASGNFVSGQADADDKGKVMKRADFNKLSPKERMKFVRADGRLED